MTSKAEDQPWNDEPLNRDESLSSDHHEPNDSSQSDRPTENPDDRTENPDDQIVEIEETTVGTWSLSGIIGIVTASSLVMFVFRMAYLGSTMATAASMVIVIFLASILAFGLMYFVGRTLHLIFRRSPLIIVPMLLLASGTAQAQTTNSLVNLGTYPQIPRGNPWTVRVAMDRFMGNGGFARVRLFVEPSGKTFSRRYEIDVRITTTFRRNGSPCPVIEKRMVVPEGATVAEADVFYPIVEQPQNFVISCNEVGSSPPARSARLSVSGQASVQNYKQLTTVGFLLKNPLDPSSMDTILGNGPLPTTKAKYNFRKPLPGRIQFRPLDSKKLSEDWLVYSDLDVFLIDGSTLSNLKNRQPEQYEAILKFVAAGGSLWIVDATQLFNENGSSTESSRELVLGENCRIALQGLSKSIAMPGKNVSRTLSLGEHNDTREWTNQYWNGVTKGYSVNLNSLPKRSEIYKKLEAESSELVAYKKPAQVVDGIRSGDYGLGKVVCWDDPDPFPGSFQLWKVVKRHLGSKRLQWSERFDNFPMSGHNDYWNWLIQSVGRPPVLSFLAVNGLFVVLMGPVSYLILKRKRRLYLMYFLGPALATLMVFALFGYAFLRDGVQTQVRIHQWSWSDAVAGMETQWDRTTVYAPFGGQATFSDQTMVTRVSPRATVLYQEPTSFGRIRWENDKHVWDQGFLPTRTQAQFLAVTPIRKSPPLTFQSVGKPSNESDETNQSDAENQSQGSDDEDDAPTEMTVTNHSPLPLEWVVYQAPSKTRYHVRQIQPGETLTMQPGDQPYQEFDSTRSDRTALPWSPSIAAAGNNSDDYSLMELKFDQWRNNQVSEHTFLAVGPVDPSRFPVDDPLVDHGIRILLGRAK